ncbi:MAG: hypothetical protein QOI84_1627 [Solirubrobacterales bacterium]|jgi:hypothetical protein|nr:hypothetical protein [Solirubrobacterales bacterium]
MRARGRHLGLAVCAIAIASLSAPAVGSAGPLPTVLPRSLALEMNLEGSDGYSVSVAGHGHRHVEVVVTKGRYFAFYRVRGSVSHDHIEADLGRFGRVSVRFDGSVRPEPEPFAGKCSGRRPIHETGLFRGAIEFNGEHGFTRVSARSVRGDLYRTFRQVCRLGDRSGAGASGTAGFTITVLAAGSRSAGRSIYFNAFRLEQEPGGGRPSPWITAAGISEQVGRIALSKVVVTESSPAEIRVSAKGVHPASADVAPGRPFAGTAFFREASAPAPEWTGDLSLRLPGVGSTGLAGEQFDADLCHATGIRQLNRCGRSAQISGSQSQLLEDARLSWAR